MKTKKQILKALRKEIIPFGPYEKEIGSDIYLFIEYANMKGYSISALDIMAISYMAAQSKLKTLFDEETLRKAIDKYDKTDPMNRFDTVGETFHDLLGYKFSK